MQTTKKRSHHFEMKEVVKTLLPTNGTFLYMAS